MRLIVLILTLTCLASCSTANTNTYTPVCAPVKEYSKTKQVQAAEELKACNCPEVEDMLKDGYVLRQSNRECAK